jgi:dienelactone hydrolase
MTRTSKYRERLQPWISLVVVKTSRRASKPSSGAKYSTPHRRSGTRAQCLALLLLSLASACRRAPHDEPPSEPTPAIARADDPWGAKPETSAQDYAQARRSFRTKLVRAAGSPQPWEPTKLAPDAQLIEVTSGGLELMAWMSKPTTQATRAPGVLFLHGGFAFGADDWEMTKPFRDAGFVVLMPILRGENGQPGTFSFYYDEVEDVLAAADTLAAQPNVDASRIYVTGHSAGGALAMLAAMASKRFRAVASLAGSPDPTVHKDDIELIPFDPNDADEFRMRSPLEFATSFKCPARLYFGADETWLNPRAQKTARRAKRAGLDVEAIEVAGDHFSMTTPAIKLAIAFFEQQR